MFATFKLLFIYLTLGTPAGLLGIPYTLLVGDISLLYRVAMRIVALGVRAAGIRTEVVGLHNIPPATACIFMCNHVSNLDPPVLIPVLPGRSSVLLKKTLTDIPILGTAMKLADFVPVERGSRRESAKASVEAAARALRKGLHILVFPEGTRSPGGRLSPFKKGPFYLAFETAAPVIPIAISGTEQMLPRGRSSIVPGIARIQFLPPINPADFASREDLLAATHAAIAAALPPSMKPASLRPQA